MKPVTISRPARGFSLIEVLIAVVVLSFGLLALGALQSRLIQGSAESKAQSVGLSLAKDRLEQLRGYRCLSFVDCGAGSYQALASSGTETLNDDHDSDPTTPGLYGGTNYTRTATVQRYVLPVGTTTFRAAVAGDCSVAGNPLTCQLGAAVAPNTEYKTVDVRVAWADAGGQSRIAAMEDAIAALDPADSARNRTYRGSRPRGPEVIIKDPSSEAGVIPIAVGDGTETAATNPKPILTGRSNDLVETRFNVLTYSGLNGGNALAQSKVETTVVGCKCSLTANTAFAYRPTYWNGLRYVPPVRLNTAGPGRAATLVNSDPPQSRYCDTCCRDHHDPSGVPGAKVSPYRAQHTHYNRILGVMTLATSGQDYLEACRLIRVEGIFDVAVDLSNDYYNLLETKSEAREPVPSPAGTTNYQNFVLDYLDNRYAKQDATTDTQAIAYFNNRSVPSPAVDATARNLDAPATLTIKRSDDQRWLHSRGLYIDYLEREAREMIADAKNGCPGTGDDPPTPTQKRNCVLRVLPFTSINLTEIADWESSDTVQIDVANNAFSGAFADPDPVRGGVVPGSAPVNGSTAQARTEAGHSTSGLKATLDNWWINPEEDPGNTTSPPLLAWLDNQQFVIEGGPPPPGTGGTFVANLINYPANSKPVVSFDLPTRDVCVATNGGLTHTCTTQSNLGGSVKVRFENYNILGADSRANPCQANKLAPMPYKTVYDVVSVASSSGAVNTGTSLVVFNNNLVGGYAANGEYTETTFNPLSDADELTATMTTPTFLCPSSYTCTGSGGNTVVYSDTFVTCPSNQRPDNPPLGQ